MVCGCQDQRLVGASTKLLPSGGLKYTAILVSAHFWLWVMFSPSRLNYNYFTDTEAVCLRQTTSLALAYVSKSLWNFLLQICCLSSVVAHCVRAVSKPSSEILPQFFLSFEVWLRDWVHGCTRPWIPNNAGSQWGKSQEVEVHRGCEFTSSASRFVGATVYAHKEAT